MGQRLATDRADRAGQATAKRARLMRRRGGNRRVEPSEICGAVMSRKSEIIDLALDNDKF